MAVCPCAMAEVFVAQFVVRWGGLIFRRQIPVIHGLSKSTAKSWILYNVFKVGCTRSLSNFANLGLYIFL